MDDQSIIPECFIDTNLTETIAPPTTQYNHQKGCGTVTKVMQERFGNRFALGIIDKDKQEVEYLKQFKEVHRIGSLVLHQHKKLHHYIIQIVPAMERFIMYNAELVNISLSDYGLPITFDAFKKLSKTVNSKKDVRFKNLFKALIKAQASDIVRLGAWINYLKEQNYAADINVLKTL